MKKSLLSIPLLLGLVWMLTGCMQPTSIQETEQKRDVILMGTPVRTTGKFAREGKDTSQGYKLWQDWVNNEYGGIKVGDKRYSVEIISYDDEGNPGTVGGLVEKLIKKDQVKFVLAPYSSSLTKIASAVAEKHDKLIVAGGASSDALFTRGFKNIFSVQTPASSYSESTLKALSEAGAKTVVIAYEDTTFPRNVAEGAQKWADKYGMKVLAVETYPKDVDDVSAIMSKFKALNPDVFVGGGHFKDALLFVRSAKELDFNPKAMLITVGPSNPEFAAELGADANYIFGPTQWESTMNYQGEYFGTAQEYAQRYQAKWGEPPTYQAAGATMAALALQLAIEKAGSLETDTVRQAMRELNLVTFYGPIQFDETGNNTVKQMGSIQILDDQIKVIAPKEAAVAEKVYPIPKWKER
ncbi:MAG: amino acid ABC transporter substrate-binding protein [Xenococcaceae cyanobacterium]